MLSDKMQAALNKQINAEIWSGYIYLSMAANFRRLNLAGAAHWMECQFKEELMHAWKLMDYIHDRGGKVTLMPIEAVPTEWDTALAAYQFGYEHEIKVSAMINDLVNLATEEKDHASTSFLQWYVDEQVEEEASFDEVVQKLKLVGDGGGLFMVDRELAQRVPIFLFPLLETPTAGGG
ncbi:MAG: ferritin [Candidatus Zipacnadales bacterium]